MSTATERAVRKSIREGTFDRVYYFFGDDDLLKELLARELVSAAVDPGTRDFNHEVLRGGETSAETLDTALSTPAMFAERRLVVVRDVHALKKAARVALGRFITRPAQDVVLLLIDPAGQKPDNALAGSATVVTFDRLDEHRVPGWIMHYASTELGVPVSEAAAQLLQMSIGSELASLASELDKLASYTGGKPIDEAAVREVVGVRHGESVPDLLDAIADRQAGRAIELIPIVLSQPKTNVVTLIMTIATQTMAIAWGRAARDRGMPAAGVERGFYALLKEGRAFPGRAWKDAVACWGRGVPKWSRSDLDGALQQLLHADAAAKEARVSSDEQLLTSLVLALCAPARVTA